MLNEVILAECIKKAVRLKLAGYKLLLDHTVPEILATANGIGPEAFPQELVDFIDKFNPTLVTAAIIHDLRYTYGEGTKADFLQANAEFEINGKLLADDEYGWYNPARYFVKLKAHEFRIACDNFGWSAYQYAVQVRKRDEQIKSVFEKK